jgi:uncharacterized protein (DUF2249 family)/CRP-like cAMP-binding protein
MVARKQAARRIDLRSVPLPERHARILSAFDGLGEATLTVVTDHEPRPLRLKLEALYPEQVVFLQRHFGIAHWEVTLRRALPMDGASDLGALLRRSAILSEAAEVTRAVLETRAIERSFAAGVTIVEQDAHWPYFGLVRSGMLSSVMASVIGRDQKLFDVLTGETFGIVETLDGGRTVARIVVASPEARVVLFPRGVVLSAMAQDFAFARALNAICAQRTRRLAERFTDHRGQPAIARVAAAILPYALPEAGLAPSLEPLRRMTQAQLALTAGTAKEVAARAIAELESAGAIRRSGGRIAMTDRSKLDAFAEGLSG